MQLLLRQGAQAAVVLLEPESFGGSQGVALPQDTLLASGILTYVVPSGSDISLMLGPTGIVGEGAADRQKVAVR